LLEESDEEVFEINDFTNATDWERFSAKIEEIIGVWHLNSYAKITPLCVITDEMKNGTWETRTAEICFTDVPFTLTFYKLKERETEHDDLYQEENEDGVQFPSYFDDMMNPNTDFPSRAHCLARWYGLRSFLVLSPSSGNESILSESKCNLLQSSTSVALNNSSCDIPFFIQILEGWRRVFSGHATAGGIHTNFDMVHLKHCPQQYRNISGLIHVFKSKIGLPSLPMDKCWVSTRFTYVLSNWGERGKWPAKELQPQNVAMNFKTLSSTSLDEPIVELQVAAMWPYITGDLITDNDVHTDFNPLASQNWAIRLRYSDDLPCLLTSYLYECLKIADRMETLSDLLSFESTSAPEQDLSQALGKITDPTSSIMFPIVSSRLASGISKVVSDPQGMLRRSAHSLSQIGAGSVNNKMPETTLNAIRDFLFKRVQYEVATHSTYELYHQLKAAPLGSFTHHFATCAMVVNLCHGGIHGIAHLWHIVVTELRMMLDQGKLIPGIGKENPDLRVCLLHQKLQMLNCCVNHKILREEKRKAASKGKVDDLATHENFEKNAANYPPAHDNAISDTEHFKISDSEDEFYECDSDVEKLEEEQQLLQRDEFMGFSPEGRLKQCGSLTLINSSALLYIPITQDHAPLTEDQLEEQANVFSKLGDTKEGSKVRARMQSASLMSDMQSFKAANPGCCLEDFVRWYSPRDFADGELSQRMKIPGNLWNTTWKNADPVPAYRQKRLFDDTKEAEKVLHFLANLKPGEVIQVILPVCVHEVIRILRSSAEEMSDCLPDLHLLCNQIESKAVQVFRSWNMYGSVANQFQPWSTEIRTKIEDILRQISFTDNLIQRAQSLKHKFSDLGTDSEINSFVKAMMEQPEINVNEGAHGAIGKIVTQYFTQQSASKVNPVDTEINHDELPKSQLPDPTAREFIIRALAPYPSSFSRQMPHRLYSVLMRNEFRLACAISTDPTFF
uniref:Rab3 GTPase-activating protein catalytic subunit n=1 Tax=Ciona savignyi TaxID=51511 RepID=H2YME1_CIOSA